MKYLTQDWYSILAKRAANRRGGGRFWLVLIGGLLILNLYSPAQPTILERLLASSIILIAFGAIWRWVYFGEGEPQFGFFPVVLIVYSLQYGLPIFTLKVFTMHFPPTDSLPDAAMEKALLLALVGLISILFGYYYPGRKKVAASLPLVSMRWRSVTVVKTVSLGFAGFGLLVFLITLRMQLSSSFQAFVNWPSAFFYIANTVLLILQLEGQLNWILAIVLWLGLIPIHMVMGMAQGVLNFAMMDAVALLVTYATMRRRIPWTFFVVGFAAFFFIQPVKASLRAQVFKGGWVNPEQDQSQKLEALISTGERGLQVIRLFDPGDLLSLAMQRLASIVELGMVVEWTPKTIPYWGGSTYADFVYIPIPRILYPEKPQILPGNVFGHKYGVIQPEDYKTSINTMQLLELYGNFGPMGVIFGSILIGMLYRTISDLLLHPGTGFGALVAGIFLLVHLTDIENAAISVFGGLFFETATIIVFHYVIRFTEEMQRARSLHRDFIRSSRAPHPGFAGIDVQPGTKGYSDAR